MTLPLRRPSPSLCALIAGALSVAFAGAAHAAEISLVESISTAPAHRPALRRALAAGQAQRLEAWRARGVLKSYRLLFGRYADAGSWDAMEILTFGDADSAGRWAQVERTAPAGLAHGSLALTTAISTAPSDLVRWGGDRGPAHGPILVIPYAVRVSVPEYVRYFDGYTVPQLRGWIQAGVLAGYELHIARYYAGRPWTTLLVLKYRDEASLDRREAVVQSVRQALAADPTWKAISNSKQSMRAEKQAAVADELASGGLPP